MSPQRYDPVPGVSSRDAHRSVIVTGGKQCIVGAPGASQNAARMSDFGNQQAGIGVPDLDCAVESPTGPSRAVGIESQRHDRGVVAPENRQFPSGASVPDVNGSVVATRGQL